MIFRLTKLVYEKFTAFKDRYATVILFMSVSKFKNYYIFVGLNHFLLKYLNLKYDRSATVKEIHIYIATFFFLFFHNYILNITIFIIVFSFHSLSTLLWIILVMKKLLNSSYYVSAILPYKCFNGTMLLVIIWFNFKPRIIGMEILVKDILTWPRKSLKEFLKGNFSTSIVYLRFIIS